MASLEFKFPTIVGEEQNPTVVAENRIDGRFQAQTCIIPAKVSLTRASPRITRKLPEDSSDFVLEETNGIRESDNPDKKDPAKPVIISTLLEDSSDFVFEETNGIRESDNPDKKDPAKPVISSTLPEDSSDFVLEEKKVIKESKGREKKHPDKLMISSTMPEDSSDILEGKKDIQGSDNPVKKDAERLMKSRENTKKFETFHREVNVFKTVTILLENCLKEKPMKDFNAFVSSGKMFSLLPDEIPAGESELFLFSKTPHVARGAVGIITFCVKDSNDRLVIYYCNPFTGHNSFGLDWIHIDRDENPATYKRTKSFWQDKQLNKTWWEARDSMKTQEVVSPSGYRARATMTQADHAKLNVKILD